MSTRAAAMTILKGCVKDMAEAAPAISERALLDYAREVEAITIRMRTDAAAARWAAEPQEPAR